ncbi:MAG: NAD-dependent epimerase [Gammaproteobacteria bacterium]|nr:NAD-dependent epimerase [Gammaproteobacteria bacterium]
MKKKQNILVTGGSGFMGSHLADALTDTGHNVTIFDIKKSSYLKSKQNMIIANIMDICSIKKAMKGIDVVYHFAGLADIDEAYNNPLDTMKLNVLGTTNVLEAARENMVKKVIFASTIYVYSRTGSFYRVSKHACELLLETYHENYGMDYTILRFGTLYGTRPNEHNSVYRFLKEALSTGKINFKGTGSEVREYIHVSDAANICAKVLDNEFSGQTLILTGHHRMRLSELLDMINEILCNKIKITYYSKNSLAHYTQTPYSYIPRVGKKIIMNTYCDLGQSLVEILDEINSKNSNEEIKL